ncbi:N-acetylmuramoyl-L-alanine amidase [Novosphingobium taihuense]|uniref:N-acetylmuramoyl-L-alanine amidase n=1 Tax=Novosphingobium taihuense TaxID=260085 RepID=A0A7W7A8U2_9SPHN|nr:N-acetylmuramoyl-L-alanine amidase [Novosphingobium taihuense]MBB4611999.1 N-acetylmuramoyl-L-alanine amidase [Novosphingobium taihuense]TWH88648.1 N-acetylmuramoyl-L-alanine amidase [Novosphingobium taihuense]
MVYAIKNGILTDSNNPVRQIRSKNTGGAFPTPPKIVVIHFTAGGSAASSANWFASKDNTNSSAHVVIDRDGTIIQCVNFGEVAWHAGKSTWRDIVGLNRHSIGIEIANWGALRGGANGWSNAAGQRIDNVVMAVHRNGNPDGSRTPIGWEAYPEAQFEATVALVRALRAVYPIAEIVGHDDIAPVRKSDPGPAFDMVRFRQRVLGGRDDDGPNTGVIRSPGGLNLRSGPGTNNAVVQLLADGTKVLPIGANGSWLEVTVLDAAGKPSKTGWVHGHYVDLD